MERVCPDAVGQFSRRGHVPDGQIGAAARRGEDIGAEDVLQRYERWRRPDNVTISLATDGLNRLFSNDFAPVRFARRLGLSTFGRIGPLRRAAMRYAAGDAEGLPATMRG